MFIHPYTASAQSLELSSAATPALQGTCKRSYCCLLFSSLTACNECMLLLTEKGLDWKK